MAQINKNSNWIFSLKNNELLKLQDIENNKIVLAHETLLRPDIEGNLINYHGFGLLGRNLQTNETEIVNLQNFPKPRTNTSQITLKANLNSQSETFQGSGTALSFANLSLKQHNFIPLHNLPNAKIILKQNNEIFEINFGNLLCSEIMTQEKSFWGATNAHDHFSEISDGAKIVINGEIFEYKSQIARTHKKQFTSLFELSEAITMHLDIDSEIINDTQICLHPKKDQIFIKKYSDYIKSKNTIKLIEIEEKMPGLGEQIQKFQIIIDEENEKLKEIEEKHKELNKHLKIAQANEQREINNRRSENIYKKYIDIKLKREHEISKADLDLNKQKLKQFGEKLEKDLQEYKNQNIENLDDIALNLNKLIEITKDQKIVTLEQLNLVPANIFSIVNEKITLLKKISTKNKTEVDKFISELKSELDHHQKTKTPYIKLLKQHFDELIDAAKNDKIDTIKPLEQIPNNVYNITNQAIIELQHIFEKLQTSQRKFRDTITKGESEDELKKIKQEKTKKENNIKEIQEQKESINDELRKLMQEKSKINEEIKKAENEEERLKMDFNFHEIGLQEKFSKQENHFHNLLTLKNLINQSENFEAKIQEHKDSDQLIIRSKDIFNNIEIQSPIEFFPHEGLQQISQNQFETLASFNRNLAYNQENFDNSSFTISTKILTNLGTNQLSITFLKIEKNTWHYEISRDLKINSETQNNKIYFNKDGSLQEVQGALKTGINFQDEHINFNLGKINSLSGLKQVAVDNDLLIFKGNEIPPAPLKNHQIKDNKIILNYENHMSIPAYEILSESLNEDLRIILVEENPFFEEGPFYEL